MIATSSRFNASRIEIGDGMLGKWSKFLVLPPVLDLHDCLNKNPLPDHITCCPRGLEGMCNVIYSSFGMMNAPMLDVVDLNDDAADVNVGGRSGCKDVALGFSGGLDSVYQAIRLQELGYTVHLVFVRGMNTYEGGQAFKYAKSISDELGMELIPVNMKKAWAKSGNPYRQGWPENPIKNEVIMALLVDICLSNGYSSISLGDDLSLSLADSVPGVNTTDAHEVTEHFLSFIHSRFPHLGFLPIPKEDGKDKRLVKTIQSGLGDLYYSCVMQGRFNKSFKSRVEGKYGVKLLGNNCGMCRKCCMHNLILHYIGNRPLPEEYVEYCWEKMYSTGKNADAKFFAKELPLETRIHNLFNY